MDEKNNVSAPPPVKVAPPGLWPGLVIFLVLALGAVYAFHGYFTKGAIFGLNSAVVPDRPAVKPALDAAVSRGFPAYEEVTVSAKPGLPVYAVEPGLANVDNRGDFELSPAAEKLLVQNGFVVTPAWNREFFPLYEQNRYKLIANFVTTDAVLHNYHLMFDHLLERLEKDKLAAELKALTAAMLQRSAETQAELAGTAWAGAARRALGFFAVAARLLDPRAETPAAVRTEVDAELALIAGHAGIEPSPLMNIGQPPDAAPTDLYLEDYSQYVPRGHYDKSDDLKAYFRTMMWFGRLNFRFKNDDEARSAALLVLALKDDAVRRGWDAIYEPTAFFVGKSDDIDFYSLRGVVDEVYGAAAIPGTLAADQAKFAVYLERLKTLPPPQLNSMPIFDERFSPDREKEIKGFRFMGQRFTMDASVFQRLIYREVKEDPSGRLRYLPQGLDIPAAMGSAEALSLLTEAGETGYRGYPENLAKLRQYLAGLPTATWTQNLYWGWLYALLPLTEARGPGYPSFMANQAWARKSLNAYLGSWTELKHDTILYAKQVYAELGGGPDDIPKRDDRGYVEPEAVLYARLAALARLTSAGLRARGLLDDAEAGNLDRMETLARSLASISEKELSGAPLSADDYELIRTFGGQLEHMWLAINAADLEKQQISRENFLDQNPSAVVADVATDPNGQVLEEGTGAVWEIYAVVPVEGRLKIAKGGVYSHYEFPWPLSDRLTDAKWRGMLDDGTAPAAPAWTKAYAAE